MGRARGDRLYQPVKVSARPTTGAIRRFLGQLNHADVFWAAVLAKAAEAKTVRGRRHAAWLGKVSAELGMQVPTGKKSSEFLGVCIRFCGPRDEKGYGRFDTTLYAPNGQRAARVHWAHRFAFLLAHGRLPAEHVGHDHTRSHSGACVNPWHLSAQTLLENVAESNQRRQKARAHAASAAGRPPGRARHGRPVAAEIDIAELADIPC
mgnify:CR=1 FL=1